MILIDSFVMLCVHELVGQSGQLDGSSEIGGVDGRLQITNTQPK